MTLSELRFIVAVAREKNFRKAAEKSFVSQPALSLGIKKLEYELGGKIFLRNRREVSITPFGQLIVNQAIIILDEAEKIKEISSQHDTSVVSPFRLGIIYSIAPYLLPLIIPLLKSVTPSIILDVEENNTKNLEELLKEGAIDAAILALPLEIPGVDNIPLYHEPFEIIIPARHPWKDRKGINPKDLANEKVLLLDNSHCFSNQVITACPGLDSTSKIQSGNSLETIRNMVVSNLGISVLPKSATTQKYNNPLIKAIPFKKPIPFRTVALVYRKSTVKKEMINQIVSGINSINSDAFSLL